MQKAVWYSIFLLLVHNNITGQKVSGILKFEEGKTYSITITVEDTTIQQAGGKAIDFYAKGSAEHSYKVVNIAEDNCNMHHAMQKLSFDFDGMNQKKSFDSEKSRIGYFSELLKRHYYITINKAGEIIKIEQGSIDSLQPDESSVIITDMLKDVINTAYPPAKNSNSFFKILPEYEVGVGDTWVDSVVTANQHSVTANTLTAITDSVIIVEFKTNAATTATSEIMGRESITKLKTITTGKIIIDRATGIIKEKTSTSQSTGGKEVMGSTLPINGKSATVIKVTSG